MFERQLKCVKSLILCLILGLAVSPVFGQDTTDDEEIAEEVILVTAQRVDEDIQDVPISVTALTEDALIEQQVITASDLQLNTPNMSFTPTNFGGSSTTIRGVGQLIIAGAGEPGVSTHVNEIRLRTNMNTYEFFDMERVEILRGPQATLFGRNATGGVINFVTKKPDYGDHNFSIDAERGSYHHMRLKGHANIPVGDSMAFRLAGFRLERSGFTENLAYGQQDADGNTIAGIDDDMDGRDMLALRFTAAIELSEDMDAWLMAIYEDEDSDRARITNQVCVRNVLPTTGCEPNGVGFEQPHMGATTGGIFGGLAGAFPLGADGSNTELFDFPRPSNIDLRSMHTDMEPIFRENAKTLAWGINYRLNEYDIGFIGALTERTGLSRQDYSMDVGPTFVPTPLNPTGYYPTSDPIQKPGGDWLGGPCQLSNGTAGLLGGCILEGISTSRMFSYDQSAAYREYYTFEGKVRSLYDGKFNFMAGANHFDDRRHGDYFVMSNSLDIVSVYGAPLLGVPPLYPGYFSNTSSPEMLNNKRGTSIFGEMYYEASDQLQYTFGMRLNQDYLDQADTSVLFNALNHHGVIVGLHQSLINLTAAQLGVPPEFIPLQSVIAQFTQLGLLHPNYLQNVGIGSQAFWSRTLNLLLGPFASGDPEVALLRLYGATEDQINAALATGAYSPERIALSRMVPIVPQFNESRLLTGSPSEFEFEEMSYRFSVDYELDADTLLYGTVSRGYKPGGLNSAIPIDFQDRSLTTFESEGVSAFEGGIKGRFFDGKTTANAAVFYYDYSALQTTRILNNSALTDNIDATITGFEIEGNHQFNAKWGVDFAYGYLNSQVGDSTSLDPTNRAGGADGWVLLNNIDFGALTATNYLAREDQLTAQLVGAALQSGAALDIRNGGTVASVSYPRNANGVEIPAYISRQFLIASGVEVSDGIPTNLEGNQLPNSPNHTLKVGLHYTTPIALFDGSITYRLDLYYQTDSYAREFNTVGDEIEAWGQVNAAITYRSRADGFGLTLWARNLLDEDNVTGHYLTSDTSGFFRNYFLTEPRIFGASVRFSFD